MFWNYLRSKLKWAILGAVSDAAAELDGDHQEDTPGLLTALQTRLNALPAASEQVPTNSRKRATSTQGNAG